jgi:hypothetical protein
MARPTKLTDEVEAKILKAIRTGNYLVVAARYAGVHPGTVHRWIKLGDPEGRERRNARCRRFRERVEQARAEAEVRHVSLVTKAGERQWRAAAFMLERGAPERWGRPQPRGQDGEAAERPEPAAARGLPAGFHPSRLSPREQEELLRLLHRGSDGVVGQPEAGGAAGPEWPIRTTCLSRVCS